MTEERIAELEKLCEAATPGPWRRGQTGNLRIYGPDGTIDAGCLAEVFSWPPRRTANAAFIASARTALPEALAEIRRLREEVETLRGVCAEAYQMAGAVGASVEALDNLSAASEGKPLPHETFLPFHRPPKSEIWDEYMRDWGAQEYDMQSKEPQEPPGEGMK